MNLDLLFLGVGLIIGFGTGWFCYRGRQVTRRELAEEQSAALEKEITALQIQNAKVSERIRLLEEALQNSQAELAQERQFNISLHAELSRERAGRNHLDQKLEQQKHDFLQLQQRLSHEIRVLMQQVIEEKSQTLSDLNRSNLNSLLQPITEKLQEFKQKIEEQHYRETRELIVLHNKLDHLESNRWPHSNGSSPHAATKSNSNPVDPESEDANEVLQYIPPALEPAATPNGMMEESQSKSEEHLDPGLTVPEPLPDEHPEGEEIRPFTPKQQVEIDNFLKRTLGRAQRKKTE